jgi:hypothetical protein
LKRINYPRITGIKYLFENERKRFPDMPGGKIVFKFTIFANGSVGEVDIIENGIKNGTLAMDIEARIRSWEFRCASYDVIVVLPIVFEIIE